MPSPGGEPLYRLAALSDGKQAAPGNVSTRATVHDSALGLLARLAPIKSQYGKIGVADESYDALLTGLEICSGSPMPPGSRQTTTMALM